MVSSLLIALTPFSAVAKDAGPKDFGITTEAFSKQPKPKENPMLVKAKAEKKKAQARAKPAALARVGALPRPVGASRSGGRVGIIDGVNGPLDGAARAVAATAAAAPDVMAQLDEAPAAAAASGGA